MTRRKPRACSVCLRPCGERERHVYCALLDVLADVTRYRRSWIRDALAIRLLPGGRRATRRGDGRAPAMRGRGGRR